MICIIIIICIASFLLNAKNSYFYPSSIFFTHCTILFRVAKERAMFVGDIYSAQGSMIYDYRNSPLILLFTFFLIGKSAFVLVTVRAIRFHKVYAKPGVRIA